jgi:hypothetical protein
MDSKKFIFLFFSLLFVVWAVFVLEGKTSIAFWAYLTPFEWAIVNVLEIPIAIIVILVIFLYVMRR